MPEINGERRWTPEQLNAISARGGTLLVSAAAGSGKTAVLVERVAGLLTDGQHPCDADRLLVVTFTSAAAAEMRERLSQRLAELIEQNPLDYNLQRQQMLLQNAHISTIHAFCLDLLRENFEKLDIPPDFRIADQNEVAVMQSDVLADIMEERYAAAMRGEDECFKELLRVLGGVHGDGLLVETVQRLYAFTRSLDDADGWLDSMLKMYDGTTLKESLWGKSALKHLERAIESMLNTERRALFKINSNDQLQKAYGPAYDSDTALLLNILELAKSGEWDRLKAAIDGFEFVRLGALRKFDDDSLKEEVKAARDEVKKSVAALSKGVLCCTESEFADDMRTLRPVADGLFKIVRELDSRFYAEKLSRGLLDFGDLEQLALRLLVGPGGKPTKLAQDISLRFDEVLVDEYQDTNPAQDAIFRAVSQNGKNLFMVGDVKQSIYRFRQAMPEIFIEKSARFSPYGLGFPAKIILGRNFRSRAGVTDAVNFVFGRLMTQELGGIDYGSDDALYPGATYYERPGSDFTLSLIDASGDTINENKNEGASEGGESFDAGTNELEARYIAREISRLIAEGFTVQGKNGPRPVRFSDFCILLRSMSGRAEKYTRELTLAGIPAYADITNGYLGSYEVSVMLSLLRILDNPLQDVPLLSVLISPVFGFTPDDAAQIRVHTRSGSLYLALLELKNSGDTRFDDFLELIAKLRTLAAVLPADRLILRIYDETGFLNIFEAMPGGELRRANLRLLLDYARSYESAGYRGLSGFLRFIDRIDREKSDLAPASAISETADVVRIMSIHKSKGLEFPVCFIAGCSKRFNREDSQKPALFHPAFGFGSIVRDEALNCRYTTLPREVVRLEAEKSSISEEMRVLYVAMTRAKEKLYAVMTLSNPETALKRAANMCAASAGSGKIPPFEAMTAQSPADWLLAAGIFHPSCSELRAFGGCADAAAYADDNIWETQIVKAENLRRVRDIDKNEHSRPDAAKTAQLKSLFEQRLSYNYPYACLSTLPSKVSVSELSGEKEAGFSAESVRPAFLDGQSLTATEAGTALHEFMQYADPYKINNADGVKAEIERLIEQKYLLPEQGKAVNIKRVTTFTRSPLFARIINAKRVWREFRFNLDVAANELFPDAPENESILLQGMADLVFEEDGAAVLLDYKTDYIENGEELATRYRTQLECYEKAIKAVMGLEVKERYLYSFHLGVAVKV